MSKTNFEAITADAQELGRFLRSLPIFAALFLPQKEERKCTNT